MLRKHSIILLLIVIASIAKQSYAQSDSTKQAKKHLENYYAPWHQTINDTSKWNVSKFGHYFSIGMGYPHDYRFGGIEPLKYIIGTHPNSYIGSGGYALLSSYSLAYKSHLVSFTGGYNYAGGYNSAEAGYLANYYACLVGESIRFKHLMVSLSAGIASSVVTVVDEAVYKYLVHSGVVYSNATYPKERGISFPIELKAFYLARNGIGVGIHISENIVTTPKYSPFSTCLSVVTGFWNKHKK
jgi:hypothetical protein